MENSVDPDEMVHCESTHLSQHCLQTKKNVFILKERNLIGLGQLHHHENMPI